jgi:hypothetical protein
MKGYRYNHNPPDYEIWISEGKPSTVNPSQEAIRDIMVINIWEE